MRQPGLEHSTAYRGRDRKTRQDNHRHRDGRSGPRARRVGRRRARERERERRASRCRSPARGRRNLAILIMPPPVEVRPTAGEPHPSSASSNARRIRLQGKCRPSSLIASGAASMNSDRPGTGGLCNCAAAAVRGESSSAPFRHPVRNRTSRPALVNIRISRHRWEHTRRVNRLRARLARSALAASLRTAAGFLPFATSPMTAAAASRAFANESAEQDPGGTRHLCPCKVYWQR